VPGGTLYVPRVYAPLLPGSIYPDKKVPVPAKGRPAMVLVCPVEGDCRKDVILDQAAQRGLVVLAGDNAKADLLRTRPEVDAARVGWLLVSPTEDFLGRWSDAGARSGACAVLLPPRGSVSGTASALPLPHSPSKKILLATLPGAAPLEAGEGTILKLYSPNAKGLLPSEALRDAVEWLAGELGTR
jgi:hypothetical protein